MVKNIHSEHRERMRLRYQKTGFRGFSTHEILDMLLYRTNIRSDTNPTAHSLLDHYGTITHVLFARERLPVARVGLKTEEMLTMCAFQMVGAMVDTLRRTAPVTDAAAITFFTTMFSLPLLSANTMVIMSCTLDGNFDAWRVISYENPGDVEALAEWMRQNFAPTRIFRIALREGFLDTPASVEMLRNCCGQNMAFLKKVWILSDDKIQDAEIPVEK